MNLQGRCATFVLTKDEGAGSEPAWETSISGSHDRGKQTADRVVIETSLNKRMADVRAEWAFLYIIVKVAH